MAHRMMWVTERVCCDDLLCALNALDEQQLAEYLPSSRGRSIEVTLMKRTRASSQGPVGGASSSVESTLGLSDDATSDDTISSTGSQTPPTHRSFSLSNLSVVSGRRRGPGLRSQQEVAKAVRVRMEMSDDDASCISDEDSEAKPAAVTAAVITFMLAMLSCPLAPCLPQTHLHLSRIPIGAGHNMVLDALRREWPDHDFDIKLHVYQKTRHVSGVAAVSPGLPPDELEQMRVRSDNLYLPLLDSGDKMIVDESKRDRDPHLLRRYRQMVLLGLGQDVPGAAPLEKVTQEENTSPIVYLRVVADRSSGHGLLPHVTDIRDEGLLYILDQFAPVQGKNLSDYVRLIAPDKSASRQHMHRSHFGRAYFVECTSPQAASLMMAAIQKDSVQNIDSMRLTLHVELKKSAGDGRLSGGLFEQDLQKRAHVEKRLEAAKAVMDTLEHRPCPCQLPEAHTVAMHSLFCFRGWRPCNSGMRPTALSEMNSSFVDNLSCYGESVMGMYDMSDTMSVSSFSVPMTPMTPVMGGHDTPPESEFESHQPYNPGYSFSNNSNMLWQTYRQPQQPPQHHVPQRHQHRHQQQQPHQLQHQHQLQHMHQHMPNHHHHHPQQHQHVPPMHQMHHHHQQPQHPFAPNNRRHYQHRF